jgi:catechol 2,3-dioxygenase
MPQAAAMPQAKAIRPNLAHTGIFVTDMDRMVAFYTKALGLTLTDRGKARTFDTEVAFMSANPEQHHQLALATGRPKEATFSTVMQTSFMVDSLDDLRTIRARALEHGATGMRATNHGNAWSIYFKDPEGNTVECYLDTPFHVPQPHGDPLDLDQSDADIVRETEAVCRQDPGFMMRADYVRAMKREMA